MRRRLRKKLHRAEFRHWAIRIEATSSIPPHDTDNHIDVWEKFEEGVHAIGMCSGGGFGDEWSLIATRPDGTVTEADRQAIAALLRAEPTITSFMVSGPVNQYDGQEHFKKTRIKS